MAKRLQSRVAFITGGAVRIGRMISEAFADAGYNIVVHYRRSAREASSLVNRFNRSGVKAWTVKGDLSSEKGCRDVFAEAWRISGGVSVLINNASIYEVASASETSWALFQRNFETNLFGPACLSREFRRRMSRRKGMRGSIINMLDRRISSLEPDSTAYTISKKALAEYTKMTALEFAPNIRVNGIAPGAVLPPKGKGVKKSKGAFTENPLKAKIQPEDVARAAVYLADAPSITGQILYVDGGSNLEK